LSKDSTSKNNKPAILKTLKKTTRNIFAKPATEMYPKQKPHLEQDYRGKPLIDFQSCIHCGLCAKECPAKAIEMVQCENKKSPELNLAKCIFCYRCAEVCPKKAIHYSGEFELATTDKASLIQKPKAAEKS
jgi:formate hydrogenlyase subunit 6/NADH:ubiquinone oxidoreductase subunit I